MKTRKSKCGKRPGRAAAGLMDRIDRRKLRQPAGLAVAVHKRKENLKP